ncbi:uncharacterized protein [Mobula birostris]|uniref:uncharacterized protein n=1 Tax=Mobula birostris TaxID=1983395 RepID=UPI003B28C997
MHGSRLHTRCPEFSLRTVPVSVSHTGRFYYARFSSAYCMPGVLTADGSRLRIPHWEFLLCTVLVYVPHARSSHCARFPSPYSMPGVVLRTVPVSVSHTGSLTARGSVCCEVLTRCSVRSFPPCHFGKVYGLVMALSAVVSLLQYPCFALVKGPLNDDPLYMNIGFVILSALAFIHPINVYLHCKRRAQAQAPVGAPAVNVPVEE